MFRLFRWSTALLLPGMMSMAGPAWGAAFLQCVPYARVVSGVAIRGDALTWWNQAAGQYKRGHVPKKGAVLAFRPSGPMVLGHVAVVSRVLDGRHVLIRHANWSVPGAIEEDVLAIDVSDEGDWSEVRVWHSPTGQMGARTNPTYGFIYSNRENLRDFAPDPTLGVSVRLANRQPSPPEEEEAMDNEAVPKLNVDPRVTRYADTAPSQRTLSAIIADVRRTARLN